MPTPWLILAALAAVGSPVPDFTLLDHRGSEWRLADHREPVIVLLFLGADCPLAKLYAPRLASMYSHYGPRGVVFVGIDSNTHDGLSDVRRYVRTHALPFPLLKDPGGRVAALLGATRNPEVFMLNQARAVRYRGRIDDQYTPTTHRAAPTRGDLAIALDEVLESRPVSVPKTEPAGCFISRMSPSPKTAPVTYTRDVVPILNRHCVVCHRRGQVAPFPLTSYRAAAGWAGTIREVVAEGRMPPWSADPGHGRFANDPSLSPDEKRLLLEWIDSGCAKGDPADLPPPPEFPRVWTLGAPDVVVPMPAPFTVPADGVVEYQFFEVDPGFTKDTWIRAAEVRPGNRAVVHHCTVFLKPPDAPDVTEQGRLGSYCLAAMALGTPPTLLPPGMAKLVPAGWHLEFVIHYTPVGSGQTDRTSLGLWLADPKTVQREVATKLMVDPGLRIPAHAAAHEITQTWKVGDDLLVLALFPHMHLRGKSFRYEVDYPDGTTEVLLNVPRYDFNWQHRYELAEPKRLPKGTLMRCTAVYDNSGANPNNPDPSATVRAGQQSWDEMFNGYWDVALAEQDLTRINEGTAVLERAARRICRPAVLVPLLAAALGLLILRRRLQAPP
jgi:peroxiredoxin